MKKVIIATIISVIAASASFADDKNCNDKRGLGRTVCEVQNKVHNTYDSAKAGVNKATERVGEWKEKASDLYHSTKNTAQGLRNNVEQIEENFKELNQHRPN